MRAAFIGFVALALAAVFALVSLPAQAADETLFGSTVPPITADSDTSAVTLGTTVTAKVSGKVTGIRFYKGTGNTGTHVGAVYSSNGGLSVKGNFTNETASGWQTWKPASAISVAAGGQFTAAVLMPKGHYAVANSYAWPKQTTSLTGTKGVYKYGSTVAYPTTVYQSSNYFIDVVFVADAAPSPTPTVTPTDPPASPTPTPTDPPTTASPTPTDPPTTQPPSTTLMGWQVTPQNVGLAPLGMTCDSLPVYTGPDKPANGAVISGQLVAKSLDLSAGGITIEKSCVRPTSVGRGMPTLTTTDYNGNLLPGADLVTIRDSEIDGSRLTAELSAWTAGFVGIANLQRNYIHHIGTGVNLMNTGTSLDALVENNYITDMTAWGDPATNGNHSDGFTIRDFTDAQRADRQVTVRNNRIDCSNGDSCTGAFFIQAYSGRIDNLTLTGNLLEGVGYTLGLEWKNAGYSNVAATNNRFVSTGWGPVYYDGGPGFSQWTDNYRYDSAATDGKGAVVGKP